MQIYEKKHDYEVQIDCIKAILLNNKLNFGECNYNKLDILIYYNSLTYFLIESSLLKYGIKF